MANSLSTGPGPQGRGRGLSEPDAPARCGRGPGTGVVSAGGDEKVPVEPPDGADTDPVLISEYPAVPDSGLDVWSLSILFTAILRAATTPVATLLKARGMGIHALQQALKQDPKDA